MMSMHRLLNWYASLYIESDDNLTEENAPQLNQITTLFLSKDFSSFHLDITTSSPAHDLQNVAVSQSLNSHYIWGAWHQSKDIHI